MNQQRQKSTWMIELITHSGAFVVRELDEDLSRDALCRLIDYTFLNLPRRNEDGSHVEPRKRAAASEGHEASIRPRWLLFHTHSEQYAFEVAGKLPEVVCNSCLPWTVQDFDAAIAFFQKMERDEVSKNQPDSKE